jgi:uncharacterized SAM-binding protein YcdF (DUF218 family)
MYVYLSKVLPQLILPVGLVLLLGVIALVFWMLGKRAVSGGLSLLALVILLVASLPFVGSSLYQRLEARFPPESFESIPVSSCIVVLGGAVGLPVSPRVDMELNEAVDRVYKAARLYRESKGGRVFVAGGNQPWSEPGPSEAALIGELLIEWGVPADAIQLEGLSRNTRENALNMKPLLEAAGYAAGPGLIHGGWRCCLSCIHRCPGCGNVRLFGHGFHSGCEGAGYDIRCHSGMDGAEGV